MLKNILKYTSTTDIPIQQNFLTLLTPYFRNMKYYGPSWFQTFKSLHSFLWKDSMWFHSALVEKSFIFIDAALPFCLQRRQCACCPSNLSPKCCHTGDLGLLGTTLLGSLVGRPMISDSLVVSVLTA